jgi:hypothetical protein
VIAASSFDTLDLLSWVAAAVTGLSAAVALLLLWRWHAGKTGRVNRFSGRDRAEVSRPALQSERSPEPPDDVSAR